MSNSFNQVVVLGNLTRDVEIKHLTSGLAVCDVGLAINDKRKNTAGEWVEECTFVDITFFGRTAEVASKFLSKGDPILVSGRLRLEQWKADDGTNRQKLKIVGERMQMIGHRKSGDQERKASDSVNEDIPF